MIATSRSFRISVLTSGLEKPVRPYVIGGVGFHQFRDKFNGVEFRDNQWTANGGVGVRIPVAPNIFVSPELRLGFETFIRAAASVGFTF